MLQSMDDIEENDGKDKGTMKGSKDGVLRVFSGCGDRIHRAGTKESKRSESAQPEEMRIDKNVGIPNAEVQSSRRKSQLWRFVGFFLVKPKSFTKVSLDLTSGAEVRTSHILR